MNKIIKILLIITIYFVYLNASAVNFGSITSSRFILNDGIKKIYSISIKSTKIDEINKKDSINIIINSSDKIRFSNGILSGITIKGNAKDKVDFLEVLPTLTTFKIHLKDNFIIGDEIIIYNLGIIIYDRTQGKRSLGLDLNGDNIVDIYDGNSIEVVDTSERRDFLAPNEVFNLTGSLNNSGTILNLNWLNPGDIDFQGVKIEFLDKSKKIIKENYITGDNYSITLDDKIKSILVKTYDKRGNKSAGIPFLLNFNINKKDIIVVDKPVVIKITKKKKIIKVPIIIKKNLKIDKISKYTGIFSNKNKVILNNFVNIIDNFISKKKKIDISIKGENDLMIIRNNIVKELEKFDISMSLKEKKIIIKNMVKLIKELKKVL